MIITSILVILTGFAELFRIASFLIHDGILSDEAGKFLSVKVTEMIDLYLIGLFLIIMALGLYQLFIDPDINLPEWLDTPSFDILKARLLIVVAVVLAVMFLGYAATATDGENDSRTGNRNFIGDDCKRIYHKYRVKSPN